MQESSDILDLLQDLSIIRNFDKFHQFIEDALDVLDFSRICINQLLLVHESLFLPLILSLEPSDDVLFLFLQLAHQLRKAIFNIAYLHFHQSFQLISNLAHKH